MEIWLHFNAIANLEEKKSDKKLILEPVDVEIIFELTLCDNPKYEIMLHLNLVM